MSKWHDELHNIEQKDQKPEYNVKDADIIRVLSLFHWRHKHYTFKSALREREIKCFLCGDKIFVGDMVMRRPETLEQLESLAYLVGSKVVAREEAEVEEEEIEQNGAGEAAPK